MNLMDLHYPTHTQKMTFHKQTCVLLVSLTCNACVRLMRWRVDKHGDMFAEQLQKTSKAGVSTRQYWPGTLKTVRARLSNTLAHARARNAWNVCCLLCPSPLPLPTQKPTITLYVYIYVCTIQVFDLLALVAYATRTPRLETHRVVLDTHDTHTGFDVFRHRHTESRMCAAYFIRCACIE